MTRLTPLHRDKLAAGDQKVWGKIAGEEEMFEDRTKSSCTRPISQRKSLVWESA
jgi:hypothetical protein